MTQHLSLPQWAAPALALLCSVSAQAGERAIVADVLVKAPLAQVWSAWSTEQGVASFFARRGHIDLRPDGDYEILFFPDNPAGQRGAEGMRLLAVERHARLAFTWNAPPLWPEIRRQRTMVEVTLRAVDERSTAVTLRHTGWGEGADWDAVFDYFSAAWPVVLRRLEHRFDVAPIDWDNIPDHLVYRYRGTV